jgi:hypothetical protein
MPLAVLPGRPAFRLPQSRQPSRISQPTPMVNLLTIIPKKTVQLKSFAIEQSSLDDSDVIA